MKFLNQRGFGLMEVVVTAGLLGALSLVVMQITKQSVRTSKTAETSLEINQFVYRLSTLMADKGICEKNFKGKSISSSYSSIVSKTGEIIFEVNKKYGNGTIEITNIKTLAGSSSTEAFVEVDLKKVSTLNQGASEITKRFPLYISVTSGSIDSCYSNTDSIVQTAVEEAVKQACLGNGLSYNPSLKTCETEQTFSPSSVICGVDESIQRLNYNAATGKYSVVCGKALNIPDCATTEFLRRNSNGSFSCISLSTSHIDSTPQTITSGSTCNIEFLSTGKIGFKCSSCAPTLTCTQIASNVCSGLDAGVNSCGSDCGAGIKALDSGCPSPSSVCLNNTTVLSACNEACVGTKPNQSSCPAPETICADNVQNSSCGEECIGTKPKTFASWNETEERKCKYQPNGCLIGIEVKYACEGANACLGSTDSPVCKPGNEQWKITPYDPAFKKCLKREVGNDGMSCLAIE